MFTVQFKPMKHFVTLTFIFILSYTFGARERIFITNDSLSKSEKEAILILPGFGSDIHGTKKQADFFFHQGYDVFIPDYIARQSIDKCVENVDQFITKHELLNYKKLHVFSYILGSWTLNTWIHLHPLNNITTIIYDRSPLQERAPFALNQDIPFLIRLVAGKIIKDFAETPYPVITKNNINIGILIESKATKLVRKHKKSVLSLGPIVWSHDSLKQEHNDYFYTWLNHDDMYSRFDIIGNEIFYFIKNGVFTREARKAEYPEPFIPYQEL